MKLNTLIKAVVFIAFVLVLPVACRQSGFNPKFRLIPAEKVTFNSFVDCNMAEAWVDDTFRIFPGKYGEHPLWGDARELKYSDGKNADVVFKNAKVQFHSPI